MPELDVSPYTPMLRRLLRAIGIGATMQLLRWKGGCRLCLPLDPRRSELAQYLSVAQVQSLIDTFGAGMHVTLPKADKLLIHARNEGIRSEHADGDSLATLSQRYGLTARHIANVVASNEDVFDEEERSQADLF